MKAEAEFYLDSKKKSLLSKLFWGAQYIGSVFGKATSFIVAWSMGESSEFAENANKHFLIKARACVICSECDIVC